MSDDLRFRVYRFFQDHPKELVCSTDTLEAAQQMCRHPESSSRTATAPSLRRLTEEMGPWFLGYIDTEKSG